MENMPQKGNFSRILRNLFQLLFLACVLAIFFWAGTQKNILKEIKQFSEKNFTKQVRAPKLPAPENPQEITYEWKYSGKSYILKKTLYKSYFDFYAAQPKTYSYTEEYLTPNWEENYFNMFLNRFEGDTAISELAIEIKEIGRKNNLSEDQVVELAMAFVQSLTYDEIKAQKVLLGDNTATPDYPYEVLYKKTGICSDKSFLAYSLIKELGYGTAIFVYENENHMSIGIQCPVNYSTYNSGYCYAETTALGNKIGLVPELNTINNLATSAKEFVYFNENDAAQSESKIIGEAKIINKIQGKTYTGIEKTFKTQMAIENLKNFISRERPILRSLHSDLVKEAEEIKNLREKMDNLLKKEKFEEYNDLVPEYNKLLSAYQKNTKSYNNRTKSYNQKINEYNKLIKVFYQT
jgi:hypothetical protein